MGELEREYTRRAARIWAPPGGMAGVDRQSRERHLDERLAKVREEAPPRDAIAELCEYVECCLGPMDDESDSAKAVAQVRAWLDA